MSEQLIPTPGVFGDNGNFLLERELGSGGMGGVYMGRDKMLDRPVAVKVMLKEYGDDPEFVEKFKKEAQAAAKLIHPNIAQIYSYGISNGMPYMAMELATGGSLYSIMNVNPGKTDVTRVLKICQQTAQALQCASDMGFVHGDIKPENILLDANGNAKLVDFGLAGMQKDTDEIWGTPYYIPPEKVKKEPVDFRADMFSLGGTLYHALTGVAPFDGADAIAVVKKRFEGEPRKPSELRADLTPAIDRLVLKLLSLRPEDRYPSFEALLEAFKEVLTSGLTQKIDADKASEAARPGLGPRRRMTTLRTRGRMLKRPGATTAAEPVDEEEPEEPEDAENAGEENEEGDAEETPKKKGGKSKLRKLPKKKRASSDGDYDEEEEEEEGSLGVKVVLIVVGVIALIGALAGGLVWYQVADKKAREREFQQQVVGGMNKAREAIRATVDQANKFADEFDAFSQKAVTACQQPTDELMKILPEESREGLKPGPTQELLDAIASTNAPVEAAAPAPAADTNAVQAAQGATNAPPAQAAAPAAAPAALPKFREPTEDEKDPASPEGQEYLKQKKAFQEEQLRKAKEPKPAAAPKPAEAAPAPAADAADAGKKEQKNEFAEVMTAMHELWERAYGCQAAAIRIRVAADKVVKKAAEADEIKEETKENMEKLAELSRTLVDMFESVKASKDVEFVRKGISFIKSKGDKTVKQTVIRLKKMALEKARKEAAEAAAAAEAEKKAKAEAERKALIEKETEEVKAKFDQIAAAGSFRLLDWKSALRQLEAVKADLKSPEGQLAADLQIRKVNDMKLVQDLFLKHLKGHQFKSNKLKNCKVVTITDKFIELQKPDGKTRAKLTWPKFYTSFPGNLNELFNVYVINTRGPKSRIRLALKEWTDAMTGAALTMQLVCSETAGANEKAVQLAKKCVEEFPEYKKAAQEIFPDVNFDEASGDGEKEDKKDE